MIEHVCKQHVAADRLGDGYHGDYVCPEADS
jgi:hypothetical protein